MFIRLGGGKVSFKGLQCVLISYINIAYGINAVVAHSVIHKLR